MQHCVLKAGDLGIARENRLRDDAGIEAKLLLEILARLAKLLHQVFGFSLACLLLHAAERGKQDADEQRDDADDHQHFGERERSTHERGGE